MGIKTNVSLLAIAAFFASCSNRSNEPNPIDTAVEVEAYMRDNPAPDTTGIAAKKAADARIAAEKAAEEARKVPDNAKPLSVAYAVRTGMTSFDIFLVRNQEKVITLNFDKNTERSLDGKYFIKDIDYKAYFGKEVPDMNETEEAIAGGLYARVNLVNGTIQVGVEGYGLVNDVYQLTDKNGKNHILEEQRIVCVRTGDASFNIVDPAYPKTPIFSINNAEATDRTESIFAGKLSFQDRTGREPQDENEEYSDMSYSINTVTGAVTLGKMSIPLVEKIGGPVVGAKTAINAPVVAIPLKTATL